MIQRADYVVPYFNNQLRLDKPPLAYWAQVATYRIFGESDFSARFPSAVAAALTALVILAWGCRIGAATVGWWAAIIFTLSLQTFVHAKAAVADMWLVLFMTLAHWAGYELICGRQTSKAQRPTSNMQRRWWWTFCEPCHHRAGAQRRDPVIPIDRADTCLPKRDGRDKPGHDEFI